MANEISAGRDGESRVDQMKNKAEKKAHEVASSAFEKQKSHVTDQIRGVASALRNQEGIGGKAAERLDRVSRRIEQKDFDDVIRDVEDFGREHPLVFTGAAALAGFAAVRFLKSSSRNGKGRSGRTDVESAPFVTGGEA